MYFADETRLARLGQDYPTLSEIVTFPMREGVLGRHDAQPCDPRHRTHWMVAGIVGAEPHDWVPFHCARGVDPFPSPEKELVDVLGRLEFPATIDLHGECVGPGETIAELAEQLGRFILAEVVGRVPSPVPDPHPLTSLYTALMIAATQNTAAGAARMVGLR